MGKLVYLPLIAMVVCLIAVAAPATTVYASESSEEDSTVDAGGLDSIGVQMGDDGSLTISGLDDQGDAAKAWNTIFIKYKSVITGIAGIATLTMLVFLIINLCKIPGSSGNPTARSNALSGVLWTGIVTAALGGVDILLAIAYNAFR